MQPYIKNKTPALPLTPITNVSLSVNITEDFKSMIDFFCKKQPHKEWSGILFYIIKGDFDKDKEIEITPVYIHLMDIGSAGYTEYDWDETVLKLGFKKPELLGLKIGHIHSHNSMTTFFSGTDTSELTDNAPHYNQYFSLIVNNRLEMSAKLGVIGKMETYKGVSIATRIGAMFKSESVKEEKDVLFTLDAKFISTFPECKDLDSISKRYDVVLEENSKKVRYTPKTNHRKYDGYYGDEDYYGEYEGYGNYGQRRIGFNNQSTKSKTEIKADIKKEEEFLEAYSLEKYDRLTIFYEAMDILTSLTVILDPSLDHISHLWSEPEVVQAYCETIDEKSYKGQTKEDIETSINENLADKYLIEDFKVSYENSTTDDFNSDFKKYLMDMINVLKTENKSNFIVKKAMKAIEKIISDPKYM